MPRLVCLFSLVSTAAALTCYQTNTATWREMEQECPQGTIYCVKVTEIPMYGYRSVRACDDGMTIYDQRIGPGSTVCRKDGRAYDEQNGGEVDCCDSHYCNSARTNLGSASVMLISILALSLICVNICFGQ